MSSAFAPSTEFEQRMVSSRLTLPSLEQQPRRQESERHAVPTVAEREQMARIASMRSDIRQAVWRHRKKAFPRAIDTDLGQCRENHLEILAQLVRGHREPVVTSLPGSNWPVGTAEQQSMVGRPACVVIWPLGIPDHDVPQPELPPIIPAERRRRENIGVVHAEASG